jgi:PEP-CTERM motif
MKQFTKRLAPAALALGLATLVGVTPAEAAVSCSDSVATTGNAGYLDCRGPIGGNVNGNAGEATFLSGVWGGNWTWQGKSDDASFGPFSSDNDGNTSGTLTFDSAIKGLFVLAIKGGPDYSFYQFDGGSAGISSLDFDTLGVYKGNGRPGPGLSHFGLYTTTTAVPEPEVYALLLGGLGMLAFMARRRRAD